jgi:hypothetical protein
MEKSKIEIEEFFSFFQSYKTSFQKSSDIVLGGISCHLTFSPLLKG